MSFIQFESATEKNKAREELREVREELLKRAEQKAKWRQEKIIQAELRGDNKWISPSVLKKIDKMAEETQTSSSSKKAKKKHKKEKQSKKDKKKKKKKKSNDTSDSSSEEEIIVKKKKKKAKYSTSESDSESESDEWVEKKLEIPKTRDDWMGGVLFATYSKEKVNTKEDKKTIDNKYNPGESSRELNPYWKNGGTGLPTFHKPKDDSDDDNYRHRRQNYSTSFNQSRGNWRKKDSSHNERTRPRSRSKERQNSRRSRSISKSSVSSSNPDEEEKLSKTSQNATQIEKHSKEPSLNDFLTDQQMNELGAKLIKAEIMGNNELAAELQVKLDAARNYRNTHKTNLNKNQRPQQAPQKSNNEDEDHIILTKTDNAGNSRPLGRHQQPRQQPEDPWGGRRAKKSKKVDTHANNERTRYYPDDDRFNLKDMFEREKLVTSNEQNEEFLNLLIKNKVSSNNDMEDIFTTDDKSANKAVNVDSTISQYNKITKELDNCDKCFNSHKMEKQLIITLGNKCYLSVPSYEDLQLGHCLIVPIQHASCSTELDEDVWDEINEFRKALINMFAKRRQECIFFENANYIKKRKHMIIHCIPVENYEILQFYFKKAIEETETEWSHNKKLISLNNKNIKRAVPKGLPYFWVNFGMENGFAHVIEDQDKFPSYFAQEIIGGFLNLEPRLWRKPRRKNNPIINVKQFSEWWKPFDFTTQ